MPSWRALPPDSTSADEVRGSAGRAAAVGASAGLRAGCLSLPEPQLAEMWGRVYADTPDLLHRQREEYLAYEESFSDGVGSGGVR